MVIGAGPGGLSAAFYSAQRGHQVTIYEKGPEPGGQLISASLPPHKEGLKKWMDWMLAQLEILKVPIRYNTKVNKKNLSATKPEAVIMATGASPAVPSLPGIENAKDARRVLTGLEIAESPAVILGAGYVGMETADFLTARGITVTVVEKQALPPVSPVTAHGYWLHHRLKKGGGALMLNTSVVNISQKEVMIKNNEDKEEIIMAASVINALGAIPEKDLEPVLEESGTNFQVIGDAKEPRRFLEAIHDGYRAALKI